MMMGTGTRSGSISTRIGAATRLMPNPTVPWITAPAASTRKATTHPVRLTGMV